LFRGTGAVGWPARTSSQVPGATANCSATTRDVLRRYVEGWRSGWHGQAPDILAGDYVFRDPFVGTFNRHALPDYLEMLAAVSGRVGRTDEDLVRLFGPMAWKSSATMLSCWREIPELGLSGVSEIVIAGDRVVRECVSYDLNVAAEALRGVHFELAKKCFPQFATLFTRKED
jgi:hypothetical protein